MENKYYTPSLEEFHVGFECEWQCKIRKESWNKQVCDTDLVNIAYSTIEHADEEEPYSEQFRVKRLNSEDIESFGFKNCGKHYSLPYNDSRKHDDVTHLIYQPITDWLLVCQGGEEDGFSEFKTRFCGYIKNKSELKKLLQQLAII